MSFASYFIRRLLFVIPLLIGITFVAFLIANAVPADPINANLPTNQLNNEKLVTAFKKKWGLDKPLYEQYLIYLNNLAHGDMGTSIKTHHPVLDDIRRFLPATIELATTSIIFGMIIGMFFGIISAIWRNSPIDYLVRFLAIIGVSFPVFLLALIGLTLLHKDWGLVAGPRRLDARVSAPPTVTGMYTIDSLLNGDLDTFRNAISHLVLPAMVLVMYTVGIISRVTRSAMLEVLNMDYVRTARAKGLSEKVVIARHALSNAMIPIVTILGLSYANLLVGSILIEAIFAWQGIGFYMFRASTSQDFPAIMGVSLLIATIYVGVNFIVDILYYFLDPRIRTA